MVLLADSANRNFSKSHEGPSRSHRHFVFNKFFDDVSVDLVVGRASHGKYPLASTSICASTIFYELPPKCLATTACFVFYYSPR